VTVLGTGSEETRASARFLGIAGGVWGFVGSLSANFIEVCFVEARISLELLLR